MRGQICKPIDSRWADSQLNTADDLVKREHPQIQKGPVGMERGQYRVLGYWPEPATRQGKTGHSTIIPRINATLVGPFIEGDPNLSH